MVEGRLKVENQRISLLSFEPNRFNPSRLQRLFPVTETMYKDMLQMQGDIVFIVTHRTFPVQCIRWYNEAGNPFVLIQDRGFFFISLEKTPTSISGEYRNKYVSVGVQSPTEIKASGGLQECADENVSKADAHSAARTLLAFLNVELEPRR